MKGMKAVVSLTAASGLLTRVCLGHMPYNCFSELILVGGQSEPTSGPVELSDFDLLTELDQDH